MVTIDPDRGERAHLAAEFALGTLDNEEKAVAESLVLTDGEFAFEVENWRKRFDALWDVVPPYAPPPHILRDILAELDREDFEPEAPSADIVKLKRSVRVWQLATAGVTALAASLLLFVAIRQPAPSQSQFVAILESTDRTPAFVAAIDVKKSSIAIRRLATEPEPDRSYQLWAIKGKSAPESLGLVDNNTGLQDARLTAASSGQQLSGVILAVTLEPKGGSPTGQPTSAPIFTGTLVQAPLH